MLESKINATHRLQKDGRWEEATEYRAEQRLKFRDEGLTKKESNEKAWEAMIVKYRESSDCWFEREAIRPRPCVDPKTSNLYGVYCSVRATLDRLCPAEMLEADKPTGESRLAPQVALPPGSLEQTDELLMFALKHPVDFLGHFGDALEGVDVYEFLEDGTLSDVLPEIVESIPAIQRIVKKRLAGALCP